MYELAFETDGWVVHLGERRWGPFPTLKRASETFRALKTWGYGPWFILAAA